jgi:hypothetical protein
MNGSAELNCRARQGRVKSSDGNDGWFLVPLWGQGQKEKPRQQFALLFCWRQRGLLRACLAKSLAPHMPAASLPGLHRNCSACARQSAEAAEPMPCPHVRIQAFSAAVAFSGRLASAWSNSNSNSSSSLLLIPPRKKSDRIRH